MDAQNVAFDPKRLTVVDHPLVQHKLHILRDEKTGTNQFRQLVTELAIFEGYEAMRDFPLEDVEVKTPLETASCKRLAGKKVAVVPILRAGLGMVDGILQLVPSARVGHVGMFRDPETHAPVLLQASVRRGGAHLPGGRPHAGNRWLPGGGPAVPA